MDSFCLNQIIYRDITLGQLLSKQNTKILKSSNNIPELNAKLILIYIGIGSRWINKELKQSGGNKNECRQQVLNLINSGLDLIDSYNNKTIFRYEDFHGITASKVFGWFAKNKGKTITFPFLFSTTTKNNWNNKPIKFVINTSKNSNGKNLTFINTESEVLFKSNTKFIIKSTDIFKKIITLDESFSEDKNSIELTSDYFLKVI